MQNEIFRQIILIEYFFMNKRARNIEKNDVFFYEYKNIVKDFKQYLYQNIFNYFIWKITKNWTIRKLNRTLNRMFFMKSKIEKMFYFRLLFINRKKMHFFQWFKNCFYLNWKRRIKCDLISMNKNLQQRLCCFRFNW